MQLVTNNEDFMYEKPLKPIEKKKIGFQVVNFSKKRELNL